MNSETQGDDLGPRLERELEARAGINAIVEVRDQEVVLSGLVDTAEAREAASDIVAQLAPTMRLTNDLEVEGVSPVEVSSFYASDAPSAELSLIHI